MQSCGNRRPTHGRWSYAERLDSWIEMAGDLTARQPRATAVRSFRKRPLHGEHRDENNNRRKIHRRWRLPIMRIGIRARGAGSVNGTAETSIRVWGRVRLRDHRCDGPDLEQPAEVHDAHAVATLPTIARSCVISSTANAISRRNACSRPRIWARRHIERRHGSSATNTCGSAASARANTTRCRCPPDNWCGNRENPWAA